MDDVLIIGAGQAGLATAHALRDTGLTYRVLEAGSRPGGSWAQFYDSLVLFSPARYSQLPGLQLEGDPDRYPTRDEVVQYLRNYADHFGVPILTGERVVSLERTIEGFEVKTESGGHSARAVVVATGGFQNPEVPEWVGTSGFSGQILHSSEYRKPSDVRGQRVAVIGAGNSAVQIAHELSQTKEVVLAAHRRPVFQRQTIAGRDVHFWLRLTGLDTGRHGGWLLPKTTPVIDSGRYRDAFTSGRIPFQPLSEAHLLDYDAWVLATGFRPMPAFVATLVDTDLGGHGVPRRGVMPQIPGLVFVGLPWQRSHAPGNTGFDRKTGKRSQPPRRSRRRCRQVLRRRPAGPRLSRSWAARWRFAGPAPAPPGGPPKAPCTRGAAPRYFPVVCVNLGETPDLEESTVG